MNRPVMLVAALIASAGSGMPAESADLIARVAYSCAENKTISAAYYKDHVDLVLSDGRTMTLPQTMSGSGIRYATADESFVFWSKANTAFVTEGSATSYADCVEK